MRPPPTIATFRGLVIVIGSSVCEISYPSEGDRSNLAKKLEHRLYEALGASFGGVAHQSKPPTTYLRSENRRAEWF